MADENPWLDLLEADSMWNWDRTYPYTDAWPEGAFCRQPYHLYIPYYRQQRVGRRWAEMTYASDAKKRLGGQDDPEWDH